jgi:hypothetical protein
MKLYDEQGNEVNTGDSVVSFRGEPATVTGLEPPRYTHQSGYVSVRFDTGDEGRYYASVFNCEFH